MSLRKHPSRIKKAFSKKVEEEPSDEEEDISSKKKQKLYLKRNPKKTKQKPKTKITYNPKQKSNDDDESISTPKTKPLKKIHLSNSSDDEKNIKPEFSFRYEL